MKKKTVITTEIHEFWVIRNPVVTEQANDDTRDIENNGEALTVLPENQPVGESPNEQAVDL